jgi:hypothetical protein
MVTHSPPPAPKAHLRRIALKARLWRDGGEGLGVGGIPTASVLQSPPPNLPHKGGGIAAVGDASGTIMFECNLGFETNNPVQLRREVGAVDVVR